MKSNIVTIYDNDDIIDMQFLESITVSVLGFCYRSQNPKNKDYKGGVVNYYPRSFSVMYYNSFLPVISVTLEKELTEATICIESYFLKTVRVGLPIFYALLMFFQIALLISYSQFDEINLVLYIPTFMAVFLLFLSNGMRAIGTKLFIKKYQEQIELRITENNNHR